MIWIALLSLAAWAYLLLCHGGFWRADQRLPRPAARTAWPQVVAIVPARNEAATIGEVLRANAASTYPGVFSVVVVDDASDDGTGAIARGVAAEAGRSIAVVEAPPLAPSWSGKLWALEAGCRVAAETAPDARYFLFADADIRLAPGTLAALTAQAEAQEFSLVSLMARLDCRGPWGHLLIPAFVFFFQKLYPFPRTNDPESVTAGAAGGCLLIRRDALTEIGGIAALKSALIDDCTLAALIKRGPPRRKIWVGLAQDDAISLRDNRRVGSIWSMVARTAYTQLRYSPWLLAGSVAGMGLVYLAGPAAAVLGALGGDAVLALSGGLAWAAMAAAYLPTIRHFRVPRIWAAALPLAALLYMGMTLDSARRHWRGKGGAWKGRVYAPPE